MQKQNVQPARVLTTDQKRLLPANVMINITMIILIPYAPIAQPNGKFSFNN